MIPKRQSLLSELFVTLVVVLLVVPGSLALDCVENLYGELICSNNSDNVRIGLGIGIVALIASLLLAATFWRGRRIRQAQARVPKAQGQAPLGSDMSQPYPYKGFGSSGRWSPHGGQAGLTYPAPTFGTSQNNAAYDWDPTAGFAPPSMPPPNRGRKTPSPPPPHYTGAPSGFEGPQEKEEV